MARLRKVFPVALIAIAAAIAVMVVSFEGSSPPADSKAKHFSPGQAAPIPMTHAEKEAEPAAPGVLPRVRDAETADLSVRPRQLTIEQLVAAARAGDPRAGCRAARQLYDCAVLLEHPAEEMVEGLGGQEASLDATGHNAAAEQWSYAQLAVIEAASRCKEVRPETIETVHTLLRQSALSGNRAAMLKYASGEFLGLSPGLEATSHPGYAAWRRDAHPMLLRAVRAGSLEAIHALSIAHSMEDGAIGGVIPDDPVESHVYKFLFHLASGEHPGDGSRLAPSQREAALRQARRLHLEIFAGGIADDEAGVLGPSWFNAGDEADADPCG